MEKSRYSWTRAVLCTSKGTEEKPAKQAPALSLPADEGAMQQEQTKQRSIAVNNKELFWKICKQYQIEMCVWFGIWARTHARARAHTHGTPMHVHKYTRVSHSLGLFSRLFIKVLQEPFSSVFIMQVPVLKLVRWQRSYHGC